MTDEFKVEADEYGKPTDARCEHLDAIEAPAQPEGEECGECVAEEQAWKTLRACLTCGHVGCDDESAGKHASKHWHDSGHAVVRSMVQTDTWAWCYEDTLLLEAKSRA